MKKLRWGVIGAGGIADRRTIPGMMLANNAELIAVMEINMELAEKSRAKWGCKRAYDSEAALLADPEIDAVYIASPVVLHAKQAMMAADAGKHILIEKPLAMTSEEGQKVVDYCESKGVKIAAGLMMRFGAYVMAMKQAIADGKIGRPVSGFSQFTLLVSRYARQLASEQEKRRRRRNDGHGRALHRPDAVCHRLKGQAGCGVPRHADVPL